MRRWPVSFFIVYDKDETKTTIYNLEAKMTEREYIEPKDVSEEEFEE